MTILAGDVVTWLGADVDKIDADELDRVIAAAYGRLTDDYDLAAGAVEQPDRVDQAVAMYAARLYRRKFSHNGIEAVGDFGPIRVSVSDPDVHQLIAKWEMIRFG